MRAWKGGSLHSTAVFGGTVEGLFPKGPVGTLQLCVRKALTVGVELVDDALGAEAIHADKEGQPRHLSRVCDREAASRVTTRTPERAWCWRMGSVVTAGS